MTKTNYEYEDILDALDRNADWLISRSKELSAAGIFDAQILDEDARRLREAAEIVQEYEETKDRASRECHLFGDPIG